MLWGTKKVAPMTLEPVGNLDKSTFVRPRIVHAESVVNHTVNSSANQYVCELKLQESYYRRESRLLDEWFEVLRAVLRHQQVGGWHRPI